jgi:hypothetical protein
MTNRPSGTLSPAKGFCFEDLNGRDKPGYGGFGLR